MSSGLETNRDFQIGLEQAWHGQTRLVEVIERRMFPEIERRPLFYEVDGEWVRHGDCTKITMDDNLPISGSVGETYTDFNPRDAWDYASEVLADTEYTIESIGMIKGRRNWFLSIHLDELESFSKEGGCFKFGLSGGLDRNQSPMANVFHQTMVCANTVQVARASQQLMTAKLTKSFEEKLQASKEIVSNAVGFAKVYAKSLESLVLMPVGVDDAYKAYIGEQVLSGNDLAKSRTANKVDELLVGFQRGRGNEGQNAKDLLNGFTEVYGQGLVGSSSKASTFKRWESSEWGTSAARKSRFADKLMTKGGYEELVQKGSQALTDLSRETVKVTV